MVPSDAGNAIDRLRKHLTGATRLDSLSESFSLFVYEALQDELTDVELRLLLHGHSLEEFPLNGLEEENLKRARLDQHRIAYAFVTWAEEHLRARTLKRRTRGTWTSVDGPFPYVVDGVGLEAESLGLVASQDLYFPPGDHGRRQGGTDRRQLRADVVRRCDHRLHPGGVPRRGPGSLRGQGPRVRLPARPDLPVQGLRRGGR